MLGIVKPIGGLGVPLETWMDRWLFQASYVAEHQDDPNVTFVSYNAWTASEEYRRDISAKLNLGYTEKGVETVSKFGGGSSFGDKNIAEIRDRSQNRWRQYATDSEFRRLVSNPHVIALSQTLFSEFKCDIDSCC